MFTWNCSPWKILQSLFLRIQMWVQYCPSVLSFSFYSSHLGALRQPTSIKCMYIRMWYTNKSARCSKNLKPLHKTSRSAQKALYVYDIIPTDFSIKHHNFKLQKWFSKNNNCIKIVSAVCVKDYLVLCQFALSFQASLRALVGLKFISPQNLHNTYVLAGRRSKPGHLIRQDIHTVTRWVQVNL